MTPFVPLDAHSKACPRCGVAVPIATPEPIRHRCRGLLPFAPTGAQADRGLGDTIARTIEPVARPLFNLARAFGLPGCFGCKTRAQILNRWFPNLKNRQAQETAVARLTVCRECDQCVAGRCTMSALDVRTVAGDPAQTCPAQRWPGDAPAILTPPEPMPNPHARSDRDRTLPPPTPWPDPSKPLPLPPPDQPARWLIYFPHGLGDHAQLSLVLAGLRAARPLLALDLLCRADGAELLRHLADRVYIAGRDEHPDGPLGAKHRATWPPYDVVTPLSSRPFSQRRHAWAEPEETYADAPATKTTRVFRHLLPSLDAWRAANHRYHLTTPPPAFHADAACWATRRFRRPFVILHPRGRCGPGLKNMPDDAILAANHAIAAAGFDLCLVDYDGHCSDLLQRVPAVRLDAGAHPLAADPRFLIALARLSALTIGIDSGPGHIFQSVESTPALIYWRKHHPINYSDAPDAPHVTHLVPAGHGIWMKGDRATGEAYFAAHYRHRVYTDAARDLSAAITEALTAQPHRRAA